MLFPGADVYKMIHFSRLFSFLNLIAPHCAWCMPIWSMHPCSIKINTFFQRKQTFEYCIPDISCCTVPSLR